MVDPLGVTTCQAVEGLGCGIYRSISLVCQEPCDLLLGYVRMELETRHDDATDAAVLTSALQWALNSSLCWRIALYHLPRKQWTHHTGMICALDVRL